MQQTRLQRMRLLQLAKAPVSPDSRRCNVRHHLASAKCNHSNPALRALRIPLRTRVTAMLKAFAQMRRIRASDADLHSPLDQGGCR